MTRPIVRDSIPLGPEVPIIPEETPTTQDTINPIRQITPQGAVPLGPQQAQTIETIDTILNSEMSLTNVEESLADTLVNRADLPSLNEIYLPEYNMTLESKISEDLAQKRMEQDLTRLGPFKMQESRDELRELFFPSLFRNPLTTPTDNIIPMGNIKNFQDFDFSQDTIEYGFDKLIKKYQGYTYGFGSRGANNSIDCSGFVYKVLRGVGAEKVPFTTSEGLWIGSTNRRTYESPEQIKDLQLGSIIAFDTGDSGFDRGRKYGIDHIGLVVKDGKGLLYLAESTSSKRGVVMTPLNERLAEIGRSTKKFFVGEYKLD